MMAMYKQISLADAVGKTFVDAFSESIILLKFSDNTFVYISPDYDEDRDSDMFAENTHQLTPGDLDSEVFIDAGIVTEEEIDEYYRLEEERMVKYDYECARRAYEETFGVAP
jgi:hypothetical protein